MSSSPALLSQITKLKYNGTDFLFYLIPISSLCLHFKVSHTIEKNTSIRLKFKVYLIFSAFCRITVAEYLKLLKKSQPPPSQIKLKINKKNLISLTHHDK